MRIDTTGRDDLAFASHRLGRWADDYIDPRLNIRVAGLPDGRDAPVLDPDIGFDDAPLSDDQRIGEH